MKETRPDSGWQSRNRADLVEYVYGARQTVEPGAFGWWELVVKQLPIEAVKAVRRPAAAFAVLVLLLFGGGLVSLGAAQDAKPGDSLYIAKRATEKTKLAFTFNQQEKARLGLEFAGNRAEEIGQILSEAREDKQERERAVDELVQNFRQEINSVKSRLEKMNQTAGDTSELETGEPETRSGQVRDGKSEPGSQEEGPSGKEQSGTSQEKIVDSGSKAKEGQEDKEGKQDKLFSANLGKEDKGVQLSEDGQEDAVGKDTRTEARDTATGTDARTADRDRSATTTMEEFLESNPLEKVGDTQKLLEQAENLLNQKDYEALIRKLDEAGDVLSEVSQDESKEGKVKGTQEAASSTEDVTDQAATSTEQAGDNASTTEEKF